MLRCVEFKFKGDKKIDQYIKILPQKQDQFDTALDPSRAEVYSLLLLLSAGMLLCIHFNNR